MRMAFAHFREHEWPRRTQAGAQSGQLSRGEPRLDRRLRPVRGLAPAFGPALARVAQGAGVAPAGRADPRRQRARGRNSLRDLAAVATRRAVADRARAGGGARRRSDGRFALCRGRGFRRRVEGAQALPSRVPRGRAARRLQSRRPGLGLAAFRLEGDGAIRVRMDAASGRARRTALRPLSRGPRHRHVPHLLPIRRWPEVRLHALGRGRPDPPRAKPCSPSWTSSAR